MIVLRGSWLKICATLTLTVGAFCEGKTEDGGDAKNVMVVKKEKAKQAKDTKTQDAPQEATTGSSEKVRAASVSPKIDIFRAEIHEHDIGLPHKVWFIPSDHPIVCLSLVFEDAGAKNVNATHPSLPMFLWPMLLRGAGRYNAYDLRGILYDCGATLGADVDTDDVSVSLWSPVESYKKVVDLLVLLWSNPHLPRKFFADLRKDLIVSYQESLKAPETLLKEAWNKRFYPCGHPYRQSLDKLGEDLSSVSVKDLKNYLGLFSYQNAKVVVSGPRAMESEIVQKIKEALRRLPAAPKRTLLTTWTPSTNSDGDAAKQVHVDFDVPQSMLLARLPGFDSQDPSYFAKLVALDVVAGGRLGSLMFRKIREEQGLAYSCYGRRKWNRLDNCMMFFVGTRNETLAQAKDVFFKMLKELADKGVSQQDFEIAKRVIMDSSVTTKDSIMSVVGWVATLRKIGFSSQQVFSYFDELSRLKYSDVKRASQELFSSYGEVVFVSVGKAVQGV